MVEREVESKCIKQMQQPNPETMMQSKKSKFLCFTIPTHCCHHLWNKNPIDTHKESVILC
jgi:hypothetical protein